MCETGTASVDYDFHPAAEGEYLEAARRYDEVSLELGDRFVVEIESAIARACQHPQWCRELRPGVRRSLVRTFPYGILFQSAERCLHILAVMHLHRHPDYWEWRLGGKPNPS